jgi:hypothetical protein
MYVPHKLRLGEPRGIRDVTAAVFFVMLGAFVCPTGEGLRRSGPAVVRQQAIRERAGPLVWRSLTAMARSS